MKNLVIVYDFDGTLTPYPWTKFEVLERCGLAGGAYAPEFVQRVKEKATAEQLDLYDALWKVYLETLTEGGFELTDRSFTLGAPELEYNPGVMEFLEKTQAAGVQNYILSSGLKVFLERTRVAPFFEEIFATTFDYDENAVARGVKLLMNEAQKVPVLRQILQASQGDAEDCAAVIYIGDGLTDYPAMKYVRDHGGEAVFVYHKDGEKALEVLPEKEVVSFATKADFSAGGELSEYVKRWRKQQGEK